MSFDRSNAGASALGFARELTGYPYIYGGTWPESGGTDCDGLVTWAYAQVGITLVRPTETTYREYPLDDRSIPNEVGDLLFIPGDPIDANPGHVVMYVSPGQVFEAEETGTKIGQFAFDTDSWEFRTRPALFYPPVPAPQPTGDDPMNLVKSPATGGYFLVSGERRESVTPERYTALLAEHVEELTLTQAEIEALELVEPGTF